MTADAPAVPQTQRATRDGFIDALRAIALVRVLIWHASGDARTTWVITTMPLMFFVAGSLLIGSLERQPTRLVLQRRLKRLLVPFWFFGALVLSVVAIVDLRQASDFTSVRLSQLWPWIVPLVNPTSSAWEGGWASSPLWYMRAYLWILLLSPLLVWAWRKVPALTLTACVALMAATQVAASVTAAGPGAMVWIVGDLGIYGFFVLLGFAQHQGRLDHLSKRDLVEWLCIALVATVVAWRFTATPDGVVNHSYVALFTLGLAWLCVALLARPWLSRAPRVPIVGPLLYWMTRRAMSIYLWHSPAIVASYWLLQRSGLPPSPVSIVAITTVLVAVACTATGWIEDVAAGRPAELLPLPSGTRLSARTGSRAPSTVGRSHLVAAVGIGVTVTLLAASWLVQPTASASRPASGSSLALPPTPSGRPNPNAAEGSTAPASAAAVPSSSEPSNDLVAVVDRWRTTHNVAGVRLAIATSDGDYQVVAGTSSDGSELGYDDAVPVTSITKTMTAAIVLQLVDDGLLSLDAPLPPIAAAPELAAIGPLTVRQLLMHSSGLVPYQEATGYRGDIALSAADAVSLAASAPLEWEPGTAGGYSNSGFLALGLLIEQVTGQPFDIELSDRILRPLGLENTFNDGTPRQGWVGESAGGVVSTVGDLLIWGKALYAYKTVLSPDATAQMFTVDAQLMSGLGAFPVCPCVDQPDGSTTYVSIGHNGGSVTMQYAPSSDILVVASFTESFWTTELDQQDVYALLAQVRAALAD